MFEEINMYSNALDFGVAYLHLYSTRIEGEKEILDFFVSVSILHNAKIIIFIFSFILYLLVNLLKVKN